jgi:hypothetical protein
VVVRVEGWRTPFLRGGGTAPFSSVRLPSSGINIPRRLLVPIPSSALLTLHPCPVQRNISLISTPHLYLHSPRIHTLFSPNQAGSKEWQIHNARPTEEAVEEAEANIAAAEEEDEAGMRAVGGAEVEEEGRGSGLRRRIFWIWGSIWIRRLQ